ncbi:ribonuclease catalytic domain-containing protein [Paraburkholderia silviterrae]|uniref:RNB domain-containing ribonuclease n=1 Tax=Paraburkholderia silviterrae TaxID=2528715 RepID=A0A4R5M0G3_9BURK|nr:RNB domain-containing ribonuclease [Paraburkholderia silviterrae]TDG18627.1 RNB domain-containing ribonuclease [Paraburkholderia silviterrae]
MNVFFEESGSFKAGSVLSRQGDAFQVELPGGRRTKVRAKDVLIEFEKPAAGDLLEQADAAAQEIDLDFLWECAPAEEFAYTTLAGEYFGESYGPVERAALVLRLHGSPVYFRRKGRGQYQRAPEDQLKMALASLERKRQQALVQAGYEEELKAGKLPEALKDKALGLLTKPDKNTIEYKALEAAAAARGISMPRLMLECGGIATPRALHEARFLAEFFPHGTGFPGVEVSALPDDLPDAADHVQAFSIDDVTTTEIDDAFSIEHLADGRVRIGIHIAAPALGIKRGDTADTIARTRLSTVYMPGDKITMLPDDFVDAFTLKEGGMRPALSLYCIVNRETQEIVATETRAERVFVKNNLRHNTLDEVVTEETLAAGTGEYPHKDDIAVLWPFAQALFEKRQQARAGYGLRREVQRNTDYNFYVDGEHVSITPRRRGSPLDLIVAELAILANSTWGAFLNDHGVPGIYRSQRAFGAPTGPKRTRMQTNAAPHEGLGVAQYAWSTSPLRRYVDLVNQWQLLACVEHGVAAKLVAPFKPKDADLFAVVQGFDETYTAYADHQRRMEYFWCLRWLQQEMRGDGGREVRREFPATVVKDDLVRFEEVPLLMHVPALGVHARGTRLMMEVMSIDELTIEASVRMLRVLDAPVVTSGAEAEEETGEDEELIEAADDSAASEAEALAEAETAADSADVAEGEGGAQEGAEVQQSEQHATEPRA